MSSMQADDDLLDPIEIQIDVVVRYLVHDNFKFNENAFLTRYTIIM